jgi:hypothetical protein
MLIRTHATHRETMRMTGIRGKGVVQQLLYGSKRPSPEIAQQLAGCVDGADVAVRPGSGGRMVVDVGGELLQVASNGIVSCRLLRLLGSDWWLRFDYQEAGNMAPVRLAGADGKSAEVPSEIVLVGGNTGRLKVLVPLPDPNRKGLRVQWHIDAHGVLRARTVPVTAPGVPAGVHVHIEYRYEPPGSRPQPSYRVRAVERASSARRAAATFTAFTTAAPLSGRLAEAHPDGFTLTWGTGGTGGTGRVHFDGLGRALEEPVPVATVGPPFPMDPSAIPDVSQGDIRDTLNLLSGSGTGSGPAGQTAARYGAGDTRGSRTPHSPPLVGAALVQIVEVRGGGLAVSAQVDRPGSPRP